MVKKAGNSIGPGIMGGIESKASGATSLAFGFNGRLISGFPRGIAVSMTGGGAYDLNESANAGGEFRCLSDINFPPFSGCLAGEGARWDAAALLGSTLFRCAAFDTIKTALQETRPLCWSLTSTVRPTETSSPSRPR
jgi:hypothetical protein